MPPLEDADPKSGDPMGNVKKDAPGKATKVTRRVPFAEAVKAIRKARLELRPVLTAERLASWERAQGIDLPKEYRVFLLEVGNGGAGPPPTGVWALDEVHDDLYGWTRSPGVLKGMTSPFPLRKRWVWGDKERARSEDLRDRQWMATVRQLRDGLLYLGCDDGKPIYWALVVNGPARGQVWLNQYDGRYEPVAPDVLSWYAAWLGAGEVRRTIPPPALKVDAEPAPRKKRRKRPRVMGLDAYLTRLRKVYEAEGVELRLKRGATPAQIVKYERSLGFKLSSALKELWQTANGSRAPVFARADVLCGYDLMTIEGSRKARAWSRARSTTYSDYEQEEPRDRRIQPAWHDDGWVPFADFGGGSMTLMEDHAPTRAGKAGQIIGYVHDPDEIVYVADSLSKLLPESIEAIEDDPYEVGISSEHL